VGITASPSLLVALLICCRSRHVARPHESLAQTATSKLPINSCSRVTHDKKPSLMSVMIKKNAHEYNKFERNKIITSDAPCRHHASAQRPIINLIGNIVTRYTWTLESFRL